MSRKSHHVVPNPKGGWDIVKSNSDRASGHFDKKVEAIDAGRKMSQHQRSEFVIHNRNGRIAQSDSHGHDPYPPKG